MTPTTAWHWQGEAVLFDLDGTLADSTASVLRAWKATAVSVGVPFAQLEPYIHGIPAPLALSMALPQASTEEVGRLADALLERQVNDSEDVVAICGAVAALDRLPPHRWAIVTSANLALATTRISAAGLPRPRVLVTAEDVGAGKPHPAPYLMAASRLSIRPERCLVFDDSEAGLTSARAAGMPAVGLLTSSSRLDGVEHTIANFTELQFDVDRFGIRIGQIPL